MSKSSKMMENPRIEEFACLGVKFRKARELRIVSMEGSWIINTLPHKLV
jgi:hypothetical protein